MELSCVGKRGWARGGQDPQVFPEKLEMWNFRGNLPSLKHWDRFRLFEGQANMPVSQNQLVRNLVCDLWFKAY